MADPVRIAVVDDDAAARRMMRRALERRGHVVLDAPDGRSGVELVTAGNVQLLLVDMRMPGELSGLGVVAELRANPDLAGLRIVMVSASAKSELLDECELVGCDAFLTKPVDFDELDTTIHDVLAAP
ncbi:MAG: response regulator [Thermoleophilia bacterium]|nr:response regulator [Thermoleophilia bacterium]